MIISHAGCIKHLLQEYVGIEEYTTYANCYVPLTANIIDEKTINMTNLPPCNKTDTIDQTWKLMQFFARSSGFKHPKCKSKSS